MGEKWIKQRGEKKKRGKKRRRRTESTCAGSRSVFPHDSFTFSFFSPNISVRVKGGEEEGGEGEKKERAHTHFLATVAGSAAAPMAKYCLHVSELNNLHTFLPSSIKEALNIQMKAP